MKAANNFAIQVRDVWESFRIYHERSYTLKDRLIRFARTSYEDFWALKGVTFDVKKGETLGIIGENGSGKSTLLKCIARILVPTRGRVIHNGRISALIELGAGFHPDLTGRENIFLNGAILGLSRKQVKERFSDIVKFAELEQFIDTPVRNYSSGMYMRLGFAIAVNVKPDVLLIDEVLGVGDVSFQAKCFVKINEFKRNGKTIIIVTHDLDAVNKFCDRVILLSGGKIVEDGKPEDGIRIYRAMLTEKDKSYYEQTGQAAEHIAEQLGTKEAEILSVGLLDSDGQDVSNVRAGESTTIKVKIRFNADILNPIFGIILRAEDGTYLYDTNTLWRGLRLGEFKKGDVIEVSYKQKMSVIGGTYLVTAAIAYSDAVRFCDWRTNALVFHVEDDRSSRGYVNLDSQIQIKSSDRS